MPPLPPCLAAICCHAAPGIVQLAIPFGNPEPKWAYAVLLTANGTGLAMAVDVGFMSQPGIDPEDPAVWMQLKLCLGEAQLVGGSLAGIDPVPGAAAPSPSPSPAPTSGAGSRTAGSAATMAASALAALLLLLALAC